jgi:hypothetical protein
MSMSFGVTRWNICAVRMCHWRKFRPRLENVTTYRDEQFQGKITTRDVLRRELNIVRLAQHQMNQYQPLAFNYRRIKPFAGL